MDLRLDRLATLYVARPLHRLTSSASQRSISILMYHSIADEDESRLHPYYRTATSPAMFASQMASLHAAGVRGVGLAEAMDRVEGKLPSTEKSVVITFDDGYQNFYTNAFPILDRYGFTAVMFVASGYIGDVRQNFNGKACLTWNEIRELRKYGIDFGSHTVTHPQLHDIDENAVEAEIVNSKLMIEEKLGVEVQSFAYPYAFPEADHRFRERLRTLLHGAGYQNGVCTTIGRPGPGCDPLFLKRLPINSCDDASLFQAKLEGSYDWLAKPQYLVKKAKSWA
jgi:peptidoglycan/xylan/chitin deacetylase (PgdA/CDA1 family)